MPFDGLPPCGVRLPATPDIGVSSLQALDRKLHRSPPRRYPEGQRPLEPNVPGGVPCEKCRLTREAHDGSFRERAFLLVRFSCVRLALYSLVKHISMYLKWRSLLNKRVSSFRIAERVLSISWVYAAVNILCVKSRSLNTLNTPSFF